MKQKQLYKASIFLSVIGLTLMYASSLYLELDNSDVGDIKKSWSGKTLQIQGEAVNVTNSGGNLFMDVKDSTGSILVVSFDSQTSVNDGDSVNVTGHVALYEGELEIIAKEIKKN